MNWYGVAEVLAYSALAGAMLRRFSPLHAGLLVALLGLIAATILREFSLGITNELARLLRTFIGFGIAIAFWRANGWQPRS